MGKGNYDKYKDFQGPSEAERTIAMRKVHREWALSISVEVTTGGGTLMKFLPRQAKHKRLRVDGVRIK